MNWNGFLESLTCKRLQGVSAMDYFKKNSLLFNVQNQRTYFSFNAENIQGLFRIAHMLSWIFQTPPCHNIFFRYYAWESSINWRVVFLNCLFRRLARGQLKALKRISKLNRHSDHKLTSFQEYLIALESSKAREY